MADVLTAIHRCEEEIDRALWALEAPGEMEKAMEVDQAAEDRLMALAPPADDLAFAEHQRVLAYCLMRLGNTLRQQGRAEEAMALAERESEAAQACGDEITLGRSLMSFGSNLIRCGETDRAKSLLERARQVFEDGDSYAHKQGMGWYRVFVADITKAGFLPEGPEAAPRSATQALAILEPIRNWTGVARGYAARARANEILGDSAAADADTEAQRGAKGRSGTTAAGRTKGLDNRLAPGLARGVPRDVQGLRRGSRGLSACLPLASGGGWRRRCTGFWEDGVIGARCLQSHAPAEGEGCA